MQASAGLTLMPRIRQVCLMQDSDVPLRGVVEALAHQPGATTADLAAVLGVSRATLHRRFPSREALVQAALAQALDELAGTLGDATAPSAAPPGERLRRAVEALVPLGPEAHLLLSHEAQLDAAPDLRRRGEGLVSTLGELVDEARTAGDLDVTVPGAWQVRVLVDLVWSAWGAVRDGDVGHRAAGPLAWKTFLSGCAARPLGAST